MRTTHAFRITAAALAIGACLATSAGSAGAARPDRSFQRMATIASAAAQPTSMGRAISDLQAFGGKVYTGFGDYGANTGPIAINAFDPATRSAAVEFVADTEAVLNFRAINGHLYAPSIDPRVSADFAHGGPWQEQSVVGAAHVFDMASAHGSLWMVGSLGNDAAAWRSVDGGASWTASLVVSSRSGSDVTRFYFAGVLRGDLYVQAFDASGGAHPGTKVFRGETWVDGPKMLTGRESGWRPVEFAGRLVFAAVGQGYGSAIKAFDGATVKTLGYGYDIEVAGRSLYMLGLDGSVSSTRDLRRWRQLGTGPAGSRSVAVDAASIYVGTASSELWAQPLR